MESFKQKRANLLNENPIASHGSWISKHSIAAGSPVHMGGSGKSPLYQDDQTRLTADGSVIRDRKSGDVVIGGGYNAQGEFVPQTKEQKATRWDRDPRNPKGSESKKRYKAAQKIKQEEAFNDPKAVARREANKAKLEAAKAARAARDKKRG